MSQLTIKYNDERNNTRDITNTDVIVTNKHLKLITDEKEVHYIPLCNVKEFVVKGSKYIRGE